MNKEEMLSKVGLFAGLNRKYVKALAAVCAEREFKKGDYLMKQDESGIGLFIIIEGSVRVVKTDSSGNEVEVGHNGSGDIMGEMTVLDGASRSASVIAESPTTCLILASWEFNSFLKVHPEVALDVLPFVVKKFRETNEALVGLKNAT
jgi:CRP/FNR family transcriptional regulator, cyclic AMP receptor protein